MKLLRSQICNFEINYLSIFSKTLNAHIIFASAMNRMHWFYDEIPVVRKFSILILFSLSFNRILHVRWFPSQENWKIIARGLTSTLWMEELVERGKHSRLKRNDFLWDSCHMSVACSSKCETTNELPIAVILCTLLSPYFLFIRWCIQPECRLKIDVMLYLNPSAFHGRQSLFWNGKR